MSKKGKWIQSAIKHPGSLREKAKRAGAITGKGTIDKEWLEEQAAKGSSTTARQARLAKTLGNLRKRKR